MRDELALLKDRLIELNKVRMENEKHYANEIREIACRINELDSRLNGGHVEVSLRKNDATLHARHWEEKAENFCGVDERSKKNIHYENSENTHESDIKFKKTHSKIDNTVEKIGLINNIILSTSEMNIGKYVLGVMASLLILVSVGLVASQVWEYIPYILKWAGILLMGGVMHGAGVYLAIRDKGKNEFWGSIASCGSGAAFITIICGNILWELYGLGITAMLILVWFLLTIISASRIRSTIFYVVSHVGALVSIALVLELLEGNIFKGSVVTLFDQVVMSVMFIAWIGISRLTNADIKYKNIIQYLFTLACSIMSLTALGILSIPLHESNVNWLLFMVNILIAATGLSDTHNIYISNKTITNIVKHASNIILMAIMMTAVFNIKYTMDAELIQAIYYIFVFAVIIILEAKFKCEDLITDLLVIKLTLTYFISDALFNQPLYLISISLIIITLLAYNDKERHRKLRLLTFIYALVTAIIYASNPPEFTGWEKSPVAAMVLFVVLMIPAVYEYRKLLNGKVMMGKTCSAALYLYIYLIIPTFTFCMLGHSSIGMLLVIIAYALHRVNYLSKKLDADLKINRIDNIVSLIINSIMPGAWHIIIYIMMDGDAVDSVLLSMSLIILSISSIMYSVKTGSISTILTIIGVNINNSILINYWTDDKALAVSLMGIIISTVIIIIGFKWNNKSMRVSGLVTVIIYVLKMVFSDTLGEQDGIFNPLYIALGGIICYGISFAYNKLDRRFSKKQYSDTSDCMIDG